MVNSNLLSLLQISDPTLPIGSYAHSNGLETYVQQGIVKDAVTAREFVTEMLSQNLQYTDAAFVSLAYDAAEQIDLKRILELDNECTAVKLPRETRQASQKLGMRLIKIFQPISKSLIGVEYKKALHHQKAIGHYS
ncbi:MAG TPA: urease accessory UreF family protein, partial [Segetibacter sp.]|nr:urease accessory UreF family protein [Segetibacter sp.]